MIFLHVSPQIGWLRQHYKLFRIWLKLSHLLLLLIFRFIYEYNCLVSRISDIFFTICQRRLKKLLHVIWIEYFLMFWIPNQLMSQFETIFYKLLRVDFLLNHIFHLYCKKFTQLHNTIFHLLFIQHYKLVCIAMLVTQSATEHLLHTIIPLNIVLRMHWAAYLCTIFCH